MEAAAKRFEFVEAAMYRDEMFKLQEIERQNQSAD